MTNYILKYYQAIEDESITVGKWVKLIYEYIINGLEEGRFFYSQKKAHKAIKFIETFCHHCEGRSDLIKLELWQKAFVSVLFGIIDEEGLRQFRECFLVVARKNGKTLFASAIANYMIFADGEYGAKGFCVAPKLEQADIMYSAIWQTIESEPDLKSMAKHRKSDIYVESTNSSFKKIAFNAKKSDGFNPHISLMDEMSSWPGDQGLKQYEVMKSALGARKQPLILAASTAGYVNEGIYDELMKRSTRFLKGDSKESRLLPVLYMIDDQSKWNDLQELQKSNPNLGVSVKASYLLEEIAVAEGSLSKKTEFLVKYCNIKQNSSQAWLDALTVEKAFQDDMKLEDFKGCYCVGGLDLSQTTDLTAACIVIEKNDKLHVFTHFWLPAEKIDQASERDGVPYRLYIQQGFMSESGQNFVDYHDCLNWFIKLVEDFEIYPLQIGYDRYSAQYLVQELQAACFHCDDVYQGWNLWPVMQELEGTLKDGRIKCGQNQLLKIHFLDSAVKMHVEQGRGQLIKMAPTAHIDGMAALLDAMTMRSKYHDQIGEQLKNEE